MSTEETESPSAEELEAIMLALKANEALSEALHRKVKTLNERFVMSLGLPMNGATLGQMGEWFALGVLMQLVHEGFVAVTDPAAPAAPSEHLAQLTLLDGDIQ